MLVGVVVARAAVHRRPLVPDHQIADAPGMVMDVALLRRVTGQLFDQRPCLFAAHPDEAMRVHRIDEQHRAAGQRVVDYGTVTETEFERGGPAG